MTLMNKTTIYLADLTHDSLMLSSNVFPLSIGLIGAYLLDQDSDHFEIDLFKYPGDFSEGLEAKKPHIVGFANYSWNFALSVAYARQIKALWPDVVIVFGGPNYGLTDEEVEYFWSRYSDCVDFHVVKEGEQSFLDLVRELEAVDYDAAKLKKSSKQLGNVHYPGPEGIVTGSDLPRIDIGTLPSPYIMGLMDKFFDDKLSPLIHTTRGCPFKCTFCTEGSAYYNLVKQRTVTLNEEMEYISERVKGPKDLFISDANFGMFKQDQEKAQIILDCQEKYGYPKYIHVSTGKNQKERVIEIVKSLNGAISMAASLQSTDETVLANVQRSNISLEQLSAAGQKANAENMGTYSELILGLPGDSLEAHTGSLRAAVDMKFDNIRMYQLILLPQTQLNTPDSRRHYEMKTKFRIMPRSFGRYSLAGNPFTAVECEEILIENSTLPFDDYIAARELDLTIEILHNGRVYGEIINTCEHFGVDWFDVILKFYEKRRAISAEITELYGVFRRGTGERLWDHEDTLREFVSVNIEELLVDERGTNEMSTGKATAFFELFEQINSAIFDILRDTLSERDMLCTEAELFVSDVEKLSLLRKCDLLDTEATTSDWFTYDIEAFAAKSGEKKWNTLRNDEPRLYELTHSSNQQQLITQYRDEFGGNLDGLGKLLMRYPHVHRLFREPSLSA